MDIEFLKNDPSKIWFTKLNSLFFSDDSGKTWTEQLFPVLLTSGMDIVFTDTKCGWLLCRNNVVYRTTNGDSVYEVVGMGKDNLTLSGHSLAQNYPNPFNPSTRIQYSVASSQNVTLKVFDVLGNEVATLVNEPKAPGVYTVQFNGGNLTSGVYFYKLQSGSFVQTKKFILMK